MTGLAETADPYPTARPVLPAVRLAPRREPLFDDELDPTAPVIGRYDRPLPFPEPVAPLVLAPRPRSRSLPDPAAWGRRLLVGLLEAAGGRRPLHQLADLVSLSISRSLREEFTRSGPGGRPHWAARALVGSVRASEPSDGVAEISATLITSRRVRAVALRAEAQHGAWRCTRLYLG